MWTTRLDRKQFFSRPRLLVLPHGQGGSRGVPWLLLLSADPAGGVSVAVTTKHEADLVDEAHSLVYQVHCLGRRQMLVVRVDKGCPGLRW